MIREHSIKVGVVAPDPLRSVGLQTILEESGGLEAYALSLAETLESGELGAVLIDSASSPDVLETLARLRRERPSLRTVVVGDSNNFEHIQEIIRAGAKGYLSATANEAEIRMAIGVVLDGSVWAPRKVLARLLESGGMHPLRRDEGPPLRDRLTRKECQVLELLMDGRTNKQIAEGMGIDPVTVKAHLGRMLRKAGAKNRIELTLRAIAERMDQHDDAQDATADPIGAAHR